MVSVPFTGSDAVPTVRRPLFEISFGGDSPAASGLSAAAGSVLGTTGTDPWQAHVMSLTLEAGCAPGVDAVEIVLAASASAPQVAIGDTGNVSLGYTDSEATLVFTGQVESVRYSVHGTTRITATNGGVPLARLRLNQSYEQQKAGDIVQDLASQAGVETDTVENGVDLPFYVLDDRRNAYQHIATLARTSGYLAYITPEGKLRFAPFTGGQAVQTFTYGVDILALDLTEAAPTVGTVTTLGEGAAASQGADAWGWLIKDPAPVQGRAGDGAPARLAVNAALRSGDAAQSAANGMASAAALARVSGRLLVPGAPAVVVGSAMAIARAPHEVLNGLCMVQQVRHCFAKGVGFTTLIGFYKASGGAAAGLGALGGVL
jgi:phage protein D